MLNVSFGQFGGESADLAGLVSVLRGTAGPAST